MVWLAAMALVFGVGGVVLAHRLLGKGERAIGTTIHDARMYDLLVFVYTGGREARLRRATLDAAKVAPGERVLDVCCGTGTLAMAATERVGSTGSVDGVDASEEMISRANEKAAGRVTFQVAPAQALPFADGTFDVVFCTLGYHHLPVEARSKALAEMHRVLRPGGRIAVVEFAHVHGLARLNPVAMLHARNDDNMLDDAAGAMRDLGFQGVTSNSLQVRGLGMAAGHRATAIEVE